MIVVLSKNRVPIRLSSERWEHVEKRHPEMEEQKDLVLETVSNPDFIQQGDYGEFLAVKYIKKTPLTEKYLVVSYKEITEREGFVITAYFTSKPSKGRVTIWKP
ncbi:MAG: hypothetical protein IBX41_06385 [Methanophagales archaeon]|nr:hypothetical protein [Methanophagales archaeon]